MDLVILKCPVPASKQIRPILSEEPPNYIQLPQSKEWCQGKWFENFAPIEILDAEDPDWQVPLVKRTFASADETHIRVWGPAHWLVLL